MQPGILQGQIRELLHEAVADAEGWRGRAAQRLRIAESANCTTRDRNIAYAAVYATLALAAETKAASLRAALTAKEASDYARRFDT